MHNVKEVFDQVKYSLKHGRKDKQRAQQQEGEEHLLPTPVRNPIKKEKKEEAMAKANRYATLVWAADLLKSQRELMRNLQPAEYTKFDSIAGGSIGQHMGHSLSKMKTWVFAAQELQNDSSSSSDSPSKTDLPGLNFDRREGDTTAERDPAAAAEMIEELLAALGKVPHTLLQNSVNVQVCKDAHGSEKVLKSTLERELAFATHHAVHHNAMIRCIASNNATSIPEGFGVSPSTGGHMQPEVEEGGESPAEESPGVRGRKGSGARGKKGPEGVALLKATIVTSHAAPPTSPSTSETIEEEEEEGWTWAGTGQAADVRVNVTTTGKGKGQQKGTGKGKGGSSTDTGSGSPTAAAAAPLG